MSLSLEEVYAKVNAQSDPKMGYVYDEPIHYVVLNNGENKFGLDEMDRLEKIYD